MSTNLLVIGDLIIDQTYEVEAHALSPEAPVPTAYLLTKESTKTPGGAGFAAAWAASQGIYTTLMTACDPESAMSVCTKHQMEIQIVTTLKANVCKTRFIDKKSGYHLLRIDNDKIADRPTCTPETIISKIKHLKEKGSRIDACLLADYKKGLFSSEYNWSPLIEYLATQNIFTLLDTRANDLSHWMDKNQIVTCWVKLNELEWNCVLATHEKATTGLPQRIITKGSKGASASWTDSSGGFITEAIPVCTRPQTAPDTTGCGDIFDIAFATGMCGHTKIKSDLCAILQTAVNTAGHYAYIPLGEKLCSPLNKD